MKRTCRVVCCENDLKPGLLMCPSCWRTIPRAMRKEWRAAYKQGAAKFLTKTRELLAHAMRAQGALLPVEASDA